MGRLKLFGSLSAVAVGLIAIWAPVWLEKAPNGKPIRVGKVVSTVLSRPYVEGSYRMGDGKERISSLTVDGSGRFSCTWRGRGGAHDENVGSYDLVGEALVLHPEISNKGGGAPEMATRFYPVHWGDRMFLVSEGEILGFARRVQEGWKGDLPRGRTNRLYVRVIPGSEVVANAQEKLTGRPVVPRAFRRYLAEPFTVGVGQVLSGDEVCLFQGPKTELPPKTILIPAHPPGASYRVERVSNLTALARRIDDGATKPIRGERVVPQLAD